MGNKELKKTKKKLRDGLFLLQMAGMPGTGKSSLAKKIAKASGAIVLDKDVIKSSLLQGLGEDEAGSLSYKILFDLADDLLDRKHSVVLDSPAFYPQIIADGQRVANEHDAGYCIIECRSPKEVVEKRLARRKAPKESQWTSIEVADPYTVPGTAPIDVPHLELDTNAGSDDDVLEKALSYLLDGKS